VANACVDLLKEPAFGSPGSRADASAVGAGSSGATKSELAPSEIPKTRANLPVRLTGFFGAVAPVATENRLLAAPTTSRGCA
jgi:hypothetical protein